MHGQLNIKIERMVPKFPLMGLQQHFWVRRAQCGLALSCREITQEMPTPLPANSHTQSSQRVTVGVYVDWCARSYEFNVKDSGLKEHML